MWKQYFVVLLVNVVLGQMVECVQDNIIRRRQRVEDYVATNNIRPQSRSYSSGPRPFISYTLRQSRKPYCEGPPNRGLFVIDDIKSKTPWELLAESKMKLTIDPNHSELIFILGNTGSGKTTVTQLLGGNADRLKVVQGKDGNKIIIDPDNKIGMTTASQTLIPELVVDPSHNLAFYDCPGFQDNRGPDVEIVNSFLLKTILGSASSVKLVFVVIYSAVLGRNDKTNFDDLATSAAKLINSMGKVRNEIGLVVTKAPNFNPSDGSPMTDEDYLRTITEFLQMYIGDQEKEKANSKADQVFISKKIAFVKSLLENHGNKIGVMPYPSQCGPLINDTRQIQTKDKLLNIIRNNIAFAHTTADDFGFPLSAESLQQIDKYREAINQRVSTLINELLKNLSLEIYQSYKMQNDPLFVMYDNSHPPLGFAEVGNLFRIIKSESSTLDSIANAMLAALSSRGYSPYLGMNFSSDMHQLNTFLQFLDDATNSTSSNKIYRITWTDLIKDWINEEISYPKYNRWGFAT